jgi:plastocyanin
MRKKVSLANYIAGSGGVVVALLLLASAAANAGAQTMKTTITTDANGTRGGVMHGNDGCMGRMGGGMMGCPRLGGQVVANASQTAVRTNQVTIPQGAANAGNPTPYNPVRIVVERGTTVTWTNKDNLFHTVTDAGKKFDSGLFGPGKTWAHTFDTLGRYDYYCSVHPWMKGVVEVVVAK